MPQPTNAAEMTAQEQVAEARRKKLKEIMAQRRKEGAMLPKKPTRVTGPTRVK